MQAGCRAWNWVKHVADDVLRLDAWGLGLSVSEASLPTSSCGCTARVIGDSARGRVNDMFVRIIIWSILPAPASCCLGSLRLSGSFPPAPAPGIVYDWKSVLSGPPVHLSADFGVICEFPYPQLAISLPPRRPLEPASGQLGQIWKNCGMKWTGGPKGSTWSLLMPSPTLLGKGIFSY